jgi:hypothetical protein
VSVTEPSLAWLHVPAQRDMAQAQLGVALEHAEAKGAQPVVRGPPSGASTQISLLVSQVVEPQ